MRGHLGDAACGRGEKGKPTKKTCKGCIKNEGQSDNDHRDKERGEGRGRKGRRKRKREMECVYGIDCSVPLFFFNKGHRISRFSNLFTIIYVIRQWDLFLSCYIRALAHVTHLRADKR